MQASGVCRLTRRQCGTRIAANAIVRPWIAMTIQIVWQRDHATSAIAVIEISPMRSQTDQRPNR
jgi:hypothetical protein